MVPDARGRIPPREVVRPPRAQRSYPRADTHLPALPATTTGHLLPAFVTESDGTLRPLPTVRVDSLEIVVSERKDRGSYQAFGVVPTERPR